MNTRRAGHFLLRILDASLHWTKWLFSVLLLSLGSAAAQDAPGEYRLTLDKIAAGQSPTGWVAAATNPSGPLAQWGVAADAASPDREKVLTLERTLDKSPGVFNLYWTNQVLFQNGEIKVRMRANSGSTDQGGGLIWRATDVNNYYVARYNPLESNFRLYVVKQGERTMLASRERVGSAPGQWIGLRVTHQGRRIQGWLNESLAWDINDAQLPVAGGVGLWSKADAASSFAGFVVRNVSMSHGE
ncbi:MAG: hypothetical protein HY066_08095 [Betaproteobacteria bacterium]|nr:hypothetical protein [Betaproteobacteria bacterium]